MAVIIEGEASTLPKRAKKEVLKQEGKAKMVEFYRHFSVEDVNSLLAKTFSNLCNQFEFKFLQPNKNNHLTVAKEQNLDGNAIFHLAKNGVLYLQWFPPTNFTDDELPPPPNCITRQLKAAEIQEKATAVVKRLQVS